MAWWVFQVLVEGVTKLNGGKVNVIQSQVSSFQLEMVDILLHFWTRRKYGHKTIISLLDDEDLRSLIYFVLSPGSV